MGLGKSKQKVQGAGASSTIDTEIRDSDNVKFKGMKPLEGEQEKAQKEAKDNKDQDKAGGGKVRYTAAMRFDLSFQNIEFMPVL